MAKSNWPPTKRTPTSSQLPRALIEAAMRAAARGGPGKGGPIVSTTGLNSGGGYSGGGGGYRPSVASAPVSTLASVPKSPILDDLIKRGIVKEGMPTEQILSLVQLATMGQGVGIDIDALMKQITASYGNLTGDIETAGTDWMQQLFGQFSDPNSPLFGLSPADPLFADYAGSMAQMDETADTNLATDLAWFEKQKAAEQAYYNNLMAGVVSGTLGGAATGSGGGGGGGGYGGGRRGYGGGGSGGGSDEALWDSATDKEQYVDKAAITDTAYMPGVQQALYDAAGNISPDALRYIMDTVSGETSVGAVRDNLEEDRQAAEAALELNESTTNSNMAWTAGLPDMVNNWIAASAQRRGFQDNPETPEVERFWRPTDTEEPTGLTLLDPSLQGLSQAERQRIIDQQAYEDHMYNLVYSGEMQPVNQAEGRRYEQFGESMFGPSFTPSTAPVDETVTQSALNEMQVDPMPPEMGGPTVIDDTQTYNFDEGTYQPSSGTSPVTDEQILLAIQDAQRATDPSDTRSNQYYVSNTLENLPPAIQSAVVQNLRQEGIDLPPEVIQRAAASSFNQYLNNPPGPPNAEPTAEPFSVGGMLSSLPFVRDEMGEAINTKGRRFFNDARENLNAVVNPLTGDVRPDILSAAQQQSEEDLMYQRSLNPNYEIEEGKYWQDPLDDEEVQDYNEQILWNAVIEPMLIEMDPNYQLNPTREQVTSTGTATSTLSNRINDPVVEDLPYMDNPDQFTNPGMIEEIDPDYEPVGFRGTGNTGTSSGKRGGRISGVRPQQPYSQTVKKKAASRLNEALKKQKTKKKSGKSFGKYGQRCV